MQPAVFALPLLLSALLLALAASHSLTALAALPDESWGYVQVDAKNDANLFWWMYGASNVSSPDARSAKPTLVILQGGPGASSFFFDGCEIGPVDFCHYDPPRKRETSWTQLANLLFVDNPSGTGYSYVRNSAGYARSIETVADQLVLLLRNVTGRHPEFVKTPLWIVGESYGGKHASTFAMRIDQAKKSGLLPSQLNLRGVALGDSWISPLDCVQSYGSYLQTLSHMDLQEKRACDAYAQKIEQALQQAQYDRATQLWSDQQEFIMDATGFINFYNFLRHSYDSDERVEKYVNQVLRAKFGIIPRDVHFAVSSQAVFDAMREDFMRPAISQVDYLLANGYQVHVYNGQLDVIVNTPSTDAWIQKLAWPHLAEFQAAKKARIQKSSSVVVGANAVVRPKLVWPAGGVVRSVAWTAQPGPGDLIDDVRMMFVKRARNLAQWSVLYGGHMVPQDNGEMALDMMGRIVRQG